MKSVIYNQDTKEVIAIIDNENGEICCFNEYYLKSYDDKAEPCFTEFNNDDKLYLNESSFIMHTDYLSTDGNEYYEEEEEDYED